MHTYPGRTAPEFEPWDQVFGKRDKGPDGVVYFLLGKWSKERMCFVKWQEVGWYVERGQWGMPSRVTHREQGSCQLDLEYSVRYGWSKIDALPLARLSPWRSRDRCTTKMTCQTLTRDPHTLDAFTLFRGTILARHFHIRVSLRKSWPTETHRCLKIEKRIYLEACRRCKWAWWQRFQSTTVKNTPSAPSCHHEDSRLTTLRWRGGCSRWCVWK